MRPLPKFTVESLKEVKDGNGYDSHPVLCWSFERIQRYVGQTNLPESFDVLDVLRAHFDPCTPYVDPLDILRVISIMLPRYWAKRWLRTEGEGDRLHTRLTGRRLYDTNDMENRLDSLLELLEGAYATSGRRKASPAKRKRR